MTTYAVTGATGKLGRYVIDELLDRGIPTKDVVAVVRSAGRAAELATRGLDVRVADYDQPATLSAALAGVDRVLLISSSEAGRRVVHHANVIAAAEQNGVEHIAYTSMLNAGRSTNPLVGEHEKTEAALRASGIASTMLRNGWYFENYTGQITSYLQQGAIVGSASRGRISAATRPDLAAAAAGSLIHAGPSTIAYELGGPAFDLPELARAISKAASVEVRYRDLPREAHEQALRDAGLDAASASFVAELDASISRGELETTSDDLASLLGRPPVSLDDVVQQAVRQGDA